MTKHYEDEPPLDIELEEMYARCASEVVRLADIRERHQKRKAVTQPHPVFPVGPDAA